LESKINDLEFELKRLTHTNELLVDEIQQFKNVHTRLDAEFNSTQEYRLKNDIRLMDAVIAVFLILTKLKSSISSMKATNDGLETDNSNDSIDESLGEYRIFETPDTTFSVLKRNADFFDTATELHQESLKAVLNHVHLDICNPRIS
jgi:hypothetical protein